jgi:fructose-specific phosphotransferase system IIC component
MNVLLTKFMELIIKMVIIPLFSKLIFSIVEYFQAKKEEAERNERIDNAVKEFKEATTDEDKEKAFLALVRR